MYISIIDRKIYAGAKPGVAGGYGADVARPFRRRHHRYHSV